MTPDQLGGIVRTLVAALGGYLAAKFAIDAGTVATVGGAVTTIIVAVWSAYTNRPAKVGP